MFISELSTADLLAYRTLLEHAQILYEKVVKEGIYDKDDKGRKKL